MSDRADTTWEREQLAKAHEALAAAQYRSYWLDRWQLDLNALMRRRGASELRAALRALRAIYRALYNASDRLRRGIRTLPGHASGARRVLSEERDQAGRAAGADDAKSTASWRLQARPVTERLGDRVDADDPQALVAVQRADMLVGALSAAGGAAEPKQRWLGLGTGAEAVLAVLSEAFPGIEVSANGGVDVAFAISDWGAGDAPLERVDELRDIVASGGRVLLTAESRPVAGALTPDLLLAHCTPEWRVSLYLPGGMEGGRDLYVLERA
jgi:hypothetical protein